MEFNKYFQKIETRLNTIFPPENFSATTNSVIKISVYAFIACGLFILPTVVAVNLMSSIGFFIACLEIVFILAVFVMMIINMKEKSKREAETGIIIGLLPHIYLWINFFVHNIK